jgi:hypothetical protein
MLKHAAHDQEVDEHTNGDHAGVAVDMRLASAAWIRCDPPRFSRLAAVTAAQACTHVSLLRDSAVACC